MKKTVSMILSLVLCLALLAGCGSEVKPKEEKGEVSEVIVNPLEETIDVENLSDCTVAVSLEKGDAYVDDSGKMMMKVKVYAYELYDMVDIAKLEAGHTIVRRKEEIKVQTINRMDSGLISINGGEENGGFDLISNDNTVYYEIGMNDAKAYYELGEAVLPVSVDFTYLDESDIEAEAKKYYPGDFLTDDAGIEYNFNPNNTSIVIENGFVIKMNKVFTP